MRSYLAAKLVLLLRWRRLQGLTEGKLRYDPTAWRLAVVFRFRNPKRLPSGRLITLTSETTLGLVITEPKLL
jgi:hypothetical protein